MLRFVSKARWCWVVSLVVTVLLLSSVAHGAGVERQPVRLSLAGVNGVQIGMTADATRQRLASGAPIFATHFGSSAYLYLPLCGEGSQGEAYFRAEGEADGSYAYAKGDGFLMRIWFWAGAMTDRGVGVGSTRAAVMSAYKGRLRAASRAASLLVGTRHRFAGRSATPEIRFDFSHGKVRELAYGLGLEGSRDTSGGEVYC